LGIISQYEKQGASKPISKKAARRFFAWVKTPKYPFVSVEAPSRPEPLKIELKHKICILITSDCDGFIS